MSCCCGRQGFGARQRGTTCTVWRKLLDQSSSFLHTVHIAPRCRAPNPCLPQQQDVIPHVVKNPQSCAPEDRQKFARNMLIWSLEINKTVIVASRWFLYYLTFFKIVSLGVQSDLVYRRLNIEFSRLMAISIVWVGIDEINCLERDVWNKKRIVWVAFWVRKIAIAIVSGRCNKQRDIHNWAAKWVAAKVKRVLSDTNFVKLDLLLAKRPV